MTKVRIKVIQQKIMIDYGKSYIRVCSPPHYENVTYYYVQVGVDRIPKSEADLLTNKTSPILQDPGYYVVILDVFHELHCLNMIRKRLYWDDSKPMPETLSMVHMDHCIDNLRQSVMCSSDVTPISHAWYPKYEAVLPETGMMHTCRDFDAIRDWARERETLKFRKEDRVEEVVHVLPED